MELRHAVWAMGPETCAHTHTHTNLWYKLNFSPLLGSWSAVVVHICWTKLINSFFLTPPPNWNCDCCRDYSYHLFYSNSGPHTCCGEEVEGNNNVILECFKIRIKMLFCREEQVFLLVSFLNLLNPQNSLHQGNACPGFALDLDI